MVHTLGAAVGMDVERFADSGLILIWGSNPITSSVHFWSFAQQAKRRGAKLVAIDPYRSDTAQKCHRHIALLPGTDGALALGIVHVLVAEGLLDDDYVERHVLGFPALRDRAAAWTPERAARVCGIEPDEVLGLARDYARIRPAAIRLNYGMQRSRGGGNAVRLIATLPALVGAWRDPAGGMLLSASGHFGVDTAAVQRPDLMPGWPQRLPRTVNMSTIGDALLGADPPVEAIVVYNANPVAVAPESGKVIRGFSREDLFTVVIEHFQTDTADYADWLLPATTQLEHFDLHKSYGHRYWLVNQPAIEPLGLSLPNSEIFRRLAVRMGFDEPCFADTDRQVAAAALRRDDPRLPAELAGAGDGELALAALAETGWAKLRIADAPFADGGFPTASGKVEVHSESLAKQGLDPVPDFVPPYESVQSDPALARRYPLAMISPPARNFLNSSFVNVDSLRAAEGEPSAEVHPDDAAARGIVDGARIRVFNDRGSFLARAHVDDRVRRGVIAAWGVWWHKFTPGGRNVNAVTGQALTDLGRAPTFYDCLVEAEPVRGGDAAA
jgi:anaerobic selenocysteine-containing dehydrogenase